MLTILSAAMGLISSQCLYFFIVTTRYDELQIDISRNRSPLGPKGPWYRGLGELAEMGAPRERSGEQNVNFAARGTKSRFGKIGHGSSRGARGMLQQAKMGGPGGRAGDQIR